MDTHPDHTWTTFGAAATLAAPGGREVFDQTDPAALSVASARRYWGTDAGVVALASAAAFPDGLAGAAHAVVHDAPLLLTAPDALSPNVDQYPSDTAPTTAYLYVAALDPMVESAVAARLSDR